MPPCLLTWIPVIAADGLYKRDVFRMQHPENRATACHDSHPLTLLQHRLSRPVRRRYHQWRADADNRRFQEDALPVLERELRLVCNPNSRSRARSLLANTHRSRVNEDSILAVQVFDQKKFKKKDQGFLGVINIRIGDVIELAPDADGNPPH